jgi:hypothetical protein
MLRSVGGRPIQGAIQTDASINPGPFAQIWGNYVQFPGEKDISKAVFRVILEHS